MVGPTLERLREEPETFPPLEREALRLFPYGTREDGACEQLDEQGQCRVYATRPLVCRIDMMAMLRRLPREEAWARNAEVCNALQAQFGLSPHFRVRLPVVDASEAKA